nr:unnamed protein product [Callosobruchus chinensis]
MRNNFILMHDNARSHTARITKLSWSGQMRIQLNMTGTCLDEEYEVMLQFL